MLKKPASWLTLKFPGAWKHLVERSPNPAWKTKPSWYLVTTEDKMIPPAAQRFMSKRAGATMLDVVGSHAIYVSQPSAVAALVKTAAQGV